MLLGLLVLAPASFKPILSGRDGAGLARIRLVPRSHVTNTAEAVDVLVEGHPVGGAPEGAEVRTAPCLRPKGVAFNVTGTVSGAYTLNTHLGIASWPGHRKAYPDRIVRGVARDGSTLLLSDDQPPAQEAIEANRAWIERKGRMSEIGPADEVWSLPDGAVLGRAYRVPQGGYSNRHNQAESARPEAFLWREGRRTSIGSWWPMDVNAQGVVVGFGKGADGLRYGERYWTGPLVRWERGRLAPIDLGGRPGCAPIVARDDGTFLLGVAFGEDDHRLAILGKRGLQILPKKDGKPTAPADVVADGRGHRHFEDGAEWQIARR